MCVWPRERLRAHVAIHIRVYVGDRPYIPTFARVPSLPLNLGYPCQTPHVYRPFTQWRYTDIHIEVYIVRAHVCALWDCVSRGALHA
jgi:hypothetical protein